MLGPLLFAVYCSPVADVIAHHGVQYHQYADDTQLRLAMHADNTTAGLSVLAECTTDVCSCRVYHRRQTVVSTEQSAAQPGQIRSIDHRNAVHAVTSSVSSVSVARVDLPVAEEMKMLGVVLDQRLTFSKQVSAVARSCNYHAQAIRHI